MVSYDTMYSPNNDYNNEEIPVVDELNEIDIPSPEPEKEEFVSTGKVANCNAAYIRESPTKASNHLAIVKEGDELLIEHISNTNWYKVTTQSGIDGYIMKELVSLD